MIYLDETLENVMMKIRKLHRKMHEDGRTTCVVINENNCGTFRAAEREVSVVIDQAVRAI